MARDIFALIFLLTVGNLAHCEDWENHLFIKMGEVLEKQEAALMKQEAALSQLKEMQEKLQSVEINLQELHQEMEHLKGIHQETKECLGRENLEHFKNISSAGQQELLQEISGVISLLQTGGIDECSEGSHNCSDYEACTDKFVQFTCSCREGFARDGSLCEDVDECAQGKDECSPHATCKNSVGSYSCSCNPPFEGDGRTCDFSCKSPAKVLEGVGCVKLVREEKTFEGMKDTCHQAGGRLLQDLVSESLLEVSRAYGIYGWLGVLEGRWLESGLPLQEQLWTEGSRESDPSRRKGRCGVFDWDRSSSSYKVGQRDCSSTAMGYCQFIFPQK
ncbi:uromodulin-like [Macrobrachium nipponense]|uniref:uromodulin-like n=1 Tax=Macrobrachium nipponense TaxID=159736 RepID=UPI0030C8B5CA